MKTTHGILAFFLLLLLLICSLLSCGAGDGRAVIAVTIPPEADFVRAVAGEDFRIITMVPPGYSPEAYEPTPRTMVDFANAVAFFSMGLPVDTATLVPVLSASTRHTALDEVVREVYPDLTMDGGRDPHIWLSPRRAALMVERIAEELAVLRPDRADFYRLNAEAYLARLAAADARVKTALLESGTTEFIVYHPAFGYLADEYGLTMHALEEHGREATAAHMAEMVELAKDKSIRVIFYQAETDSRQAEAFARDIGGRAACLAPLSEDYIGNLESMASAIADAKGE